MKYDLIFYLAKKTGYCEKRLRSVMKAIGASSNRVVSATSPTELGEEVTHSLRLCPLTVIVGGLSAPGQENLATVLSRVFSNSTLTLDNMRRLDSGGYEGYIVRCKNQALLALPDSPDGIEALLSEELLDYLDSKLNK